MSRSKWKFPVTIVHNQKKRGPIQIWERNKTITKYFLNKKLQIHNGKSFVFLRLSLSHLGYKFGEFSFTRKYNPPKQKVKKAKK